MANSAAGGCVSISVDVGQTGTPGAGGAKTGESLLLAVLARFENSESPATWAFVDPIGAPAVARIASSAQRHEIAILADGARAVDSQHPRSEFMRHVIRPLQLAAKAARPISTLALRQPWQPRHVDLLIKYGITMVRSARPLNPGTQNFPLQSICYGLGHVGVSASVSGGGWRASRSEIGTAVRAIRQAALTGGFCHLRIDLAPELESDPRSVLHSIDRLLGEVDDLRSHGRIHVETLRQAAARLHRKRSAPAAQSILRAA